MPVPVRPMVMCNGDAGIVLISFLAVAKVNDAAVDQGYQGGYGAGSGGPSKREEADQGYQGIAPSKREDADQGYQGAGSGYPSKREEADQGYQGYGQG